ncbi:hypothetical protein HN858_03015 [Candidatus Falkowbacteria bacterium]|jgi:sugar-specific transcriptional regulator TrmB|nr:hypothetical protein [Candidatus Falkowbacteria bacterium]MBT5502928.1 hypothetical protein [Candidatus Falkowbacteria bacterium]MBT6574055.1 hypothetical protein [Candidatus Falkowbacteria bacterium]MBT7348624.1 hypothetical protein [Candidatus Falkowbacteria bacterium]MBT7500415.1 hypothetical protein [Candidatus Falkowbacteria bacterium]
MKLKQLFSLFNLRDVELHLYETLLHGGTLSASQLANKAKFSRTAVYDLLKKLIETGLINETRHLGVKMFAVEPPEKVELLLQEKKEQLELAQSNLTEFKKSYQEKGKQKKPSLLMFEGQREMQQMIKDVLLYRDISVQIYWPDKEVIEMFEIEFMEKYHKERIARNIKVEVLRPESEIKDAQQYEFLNVGENYLREVKIAPKEMDFKFGYAVYKDTVRFISLTKDHFGFLVESHELAELMKAQFKVIWNQSKSIKG